MSSTLDLSSKDIMTLAISSGLAMILAYYFAPGGGSLTAAAWVGLANLGVDLAAILLVSHFYV